MLAPTRAHNGPRLHAITLAVRKVKRPSSSTMSRIKTLTGFSLFDSAYFRTVSKSLFAAFSSTDTFSQHFLGNVAAKFPSILEAVSQGLRHAGDSNSARHQF